MSIWPLRMSVKSAPKLMSFSPTFSGALVNATALMFLLESFAGKKRFSRGDLRKTTKSLRFASLETLRFLAHERHYRFRHLST